MRFIRMRRPERGGSEFNVAAKRLDPLVSGGAVGRATGILFMGGGGVVCLVG